MTERPNTESLVELEQIREKMFLVLPVVSEEKRNLDVLYGNLKEAEAQYFGLIDQSEGMLDLLNAPVIQITESLREIDQDIKSEKLAIMSLSPTETVSRISVLKGRIRESMGKKDFNPPFWFRIISPVVMPLIKAYLGGGAVEVHPRIAELYRVRKEIAETLERAVESAKEQGDKLKNDYKERIEKAQVEAKRKRNDLFKFTDEIASNEWNVAVSYSKAFPERQDNIATLYTQKFVTTPFELADLESFILQNPVFRASGLDEKLGRLRFGDWFVNHTTPSLEEYNRLSDNIKQGWTRHVRQKFLEEVRA